MSVAHSPRDGMSDDARTRIESVFEAALDCPPGERQDFVERACGGDASMAAAVRSLLAAHDRSGGMLEQEFGRMLLGSA
ncbi:MAG TPA: hypothetical protein VK939_16265, partial [Longimicrobiales bacterium]|nr:hypothetical protein [Longimicrobiales bacterium]